MKNLFRFILGILFVVFSIYSFAYFLPAPAIGLNHSLEMYDKEGNLFYASANDHYGTYVKLDEVSPNFLNAVISIEDYKFYNHAGFDFFGIIRAFLTNLTYGNLSQGASTISQQYVKNLFLSNEKTWERKIKEAWLTIRIETHYTKDEILEGYVNCLYFGDGVYGIENAANYFFNKQAKDLTLLEGSLLAGMINGPELYSPYRNYELTKSRQQLVLKSLFNHQYISKDEYKANLNKDITLVKHNDISETSTLGYFRQFVYQELYHLGYDTFDGKLQIHTTLDTSLQKDITLQLNNNITNHLQAAGVILEPNSGAVRVLIGGKNYSESQFNRATEASRQMASTIKPLLYYEALLNGFHPLSKFISEKTTFYLENNQSYTPTNYNDLYPNKDITMIEAIASSDNIYAVKMHLFLGPSTLSDRLKSLGYTKIDTTPSLALGTKETTPIDLCAIYNCIASKGIYYEPYCIESIVYNEKEIYSNETKGIKKLDETYCLILSQLLTSTFNKDLNGTMSNYHVNSTFAAKTGTSDWDSWLIAYNPQMTFTFWSGYDDNEYLEYMNQFKLRELFYETFKNQQYTWYQPNNEIVQVPINLTTCEISDGGEIYWFFSSNKKLRI